MMRLGSVLLASGLLALGGCSLLSGLDELSANANEASGGAAGDAGGGPICLPGKKACSGDCVPIDAPATGCAALSCAPCDLARASAICVGGACVVAQCAAGFEDCNGDSNDGCEADLKSGVTSCGACGASCSLPHANVSCTAGTCAFEGCEVGFENCDGDESNGCEANVQSDPTRCGSCTTSCTVPFGKSATCEQGKCGVSNCAPPLADCDKDSAGSCETNLSENEASCGFCGNACAFTNGNAACAQGVCTLSNCKTGFGNCDGNDANGCEIATSSSLQHCGKCGTVCAGGSQGVPECVSAKCGLKCTVGSADCDGMVSNGCETSLSTVANCKACGAKVAASGAAGGNHPRFLRNVSATGSQLTFQSCKWDSEYGDDCTTHSVTVGTGTGSGVAGSRHPHFLRRVTATGSTLAFDVCYWDSESGDNCKSQLITLSGVVASGSAGANHPSFLRRATGSGTSIVFEACNWEFEYGDKCNSQALTFSCAP